MRTILLPISPAPVKAEPYIISYAQEHEPFLGGEQFRVLRVGTRFGLRVELPPMKYDTAMAWIARLAQADGSLVAYDFRQSGATLSLAGNLTAAQPVAANTFSLPFNGKVGGVNREGQFFSLIHAARRYLHLWTEDNGINIWPLLRTSVSAGDVLDHQAPKIEGLLTGDAASWTVDRALSVGLSFEIKESK